MEMVEVTPLRRTVASFSRSEVTSCHQQGHVSSEMMLQQNPSILSYGYGLT